MVAAVADVLLFSGYIGVFRICPIVTVYLGKTMADAVWSNFMAFLSDAPLPVNRASCQRAEVRCALETSPMSGHGGRGQVEPTRRLDAATLRHLAAQFVVDGSRARNSMDITVQKPPTMLVDTETRKQEKVGIENMQSQSIVIFSWFLSVVPTMIEHLKQRGQEAKEEFKEEILDLENLLPAPLFQSLFFIWEEQPEEDKPNWFSILVEWHRRLAAKLSRSYQRFLNAVSQEEDTNLIPSVTTTPTEASAPVSPTANPTTTHTSESLSTLPTSSVDPDFNPLLAFAAFFPRT